MEECVHKRPKLDWDIHSVLKMHAILHQKFMGLPNWKNKNPAYQYGLEQSSSCSLYKGVDLEALTGPITLLLGGYSHLLYLPGLSGTPQSST